MSILKRAVLVSTVLLPLQAMLQTVQANDSLSGITTAYTDQCPFEENAKLDFRINKIVLGSEKALSYLDDQKAEIGNTAKDLGVEIVEMTDYNYTVSPFDGRGDQEGEDLWTLRGTLSIVFKTEDGAKKAMLALADKGFKISLSVTRNKPRYCKKAR